MAISVLSLMGMIGISVGSGTPATAGQNCGAVLVAGGQWLGGSGVDVHFNDRGQDPGASCAGFSVDNPAAQNGYGWQCVELAARLYAVKGWGAVRADGGASAGAYQYGAKYIPEGSRRDLTFHPNGDGYVPVPGDLVIEGGKTFGHVSIVDRVSAGTIFVVEQNRSTSGRHSYASSGSTISGAVRGVMHSPKNTATGTSGTTIAQARNKDGRLELFAIGAANDLYRRSQDAPGGTWSSWSHVDGGSTDIAAETNADGRIELFSVGTANDLYRRSQKSPGGTWWPWSRMDGGMTKVAVARNRDGRLELFGIGTSNDLYRRSQKSPGRPWSDWSRMDGGMTDIAAETNSNGRIELIGVGTANDLYRRSQKSPGGHWSGWSRMDGGLTKVALARNGNDRLELFGIGTENDLYRRSQDSPGGPWSSWSRLDGGLTQVAAETNADGRIELFGVGTADDLYRRSQDSPGGKWSVWSRLDGGIHT